MITAGINEKACVAIDRNDPSVGCGCSEQMLKSIKTLFRGSVNAAAGAVLMIITDPPDVLADIARCLARHDRIVSSGTYIDSLRFRVHLAKRPGVSPASVDAQILGEHGKSAVFLWSTALVQGVPILQALGKEG